MSSNHFSVLLPGIILSFLISVPATAQPSGTTAWPKFNYQHSLKDAQKGHVDDQVALGIHYQYGNGVARDLEQAEFWLHRAADTGNTAAQIQLGVLYLESEMQASHSEDAIRWFMRAATGGSAEAEFNLGYMYSRGVGTRFNLSEGERWLRKAARHGASRAWPALALLLVNSSDHERQAEGLSILTTAAKRNDADGVYLLGLCYEFGIAVLADPKQATEMYLQAAKAGSHEAMFAVGSMYFQGKGIEQDFKNALTWEKRGCDAGQIASCWFVGQMFLQGTGTAKNAALAYQYLSIGKGNAEVLAKIAGSLKEHERDVASAEAQKWNKAHPAAVTLGPQFLKLPERAGIAETAGQ